MTEVDVAVAETVLETGVHTSQLEVETTVTTEEVEITDDHVLDSEE